VLLCSSHWEFQWKRIVSKMFSRSFFFPRFWNEELPCPRCELRVIRGFQNRVASVPSQTPPPPKKKALRASSGIASKPRFWNAISDHFFFNICKGSFGGRSPGRAWPSGRALRLASWGSAVQFRASSFAMGWDNVTILFDMYPKCELSASRPRPSTFMLFRGRKRASFQGRLAGSMLEGEEQLPHCTSCAYPFKFCYVSLHICVAAIQPLEITMEPYGVKDVSIIILLFTVLT